MATFNFNNITKLYYGSTLVDSLYSKYLKQYPSISIEDPHWTKVELYVANDPIDRSSKNRLITNFSNVNTDALEPTSIRFSEVGYLQINSLPAVNQIDDITIDFWIKLPSLASIDYSILYSEHINIKINPTNIVYTELAETKTFVLPTISANQWYHIAIVRKNNTTTNELRVFINGTEVSGGPQSIILQSLLISNINYLGRIGTNYCQGVKLKNFRFTKGVARYTQNFDPVSQIHDSNTGTNPLLALSPVLFLDANDPSTITTVSGAVSQWRDKSGNNFHATQGTSANRPIVVTDGLNSTDVIRFDGTNDNLVSTGSYISREVFILFKLITYSNQGFILYIPEGSIVLKMYPSPNNLYFDATSAVWRNGVSAPSPISIDTSNFWLIHGRTYETVNKTRTLNLGNSQHYEISQVLIFDRTLTQAEREQVEGGMLWNVGLQANLPSNHPYKNSAP